jgi:glycosyltransferase involved in cell wall biosynthesis
MTLVSSFTPDEPLEPFLRAAAKVPDVTFHVTGNPDRAPAAIHALRPPNVRFTGFLPAGAYTALLMQSDAVLALTTEDFTMQRGAYEAIYLGRPVVVSGFNVLRESFFQGAVYTDNSVASIVEAIADMRANHARLEAEARQLREHKKAVWRNRERELLEIAYS